MVAECLHRDFPYLDNVNLDMRMLGFQATLVPFLQFMSAARLDMWASHLNQAMVLYGAEWPMIFAGPEQNLGEYEFSKSRRDQPIEVLAVIPKYQQVRGNREIKKNPSLTIVYRGVTDNKIHHLIIDSYTRCSDGFGYENVWMNGHLLNRGPGHFIEPTVDLVTSPIHKNGLYCQGINANVAYMTMEETIEDAMLVSRSAADRMMTSEIHQEIITIDVSDHPLNSYGDTSEFKFLPDIGEQVGADGVLCAFRPINAETFVPNMMRQELDKRQTLHDKIYYVTPGATILDLNFFISRNAKVPKALYTQMDKYTYAITRYWQEIVAVYGKYHKQYQLGEDFSTHVNTAIQRLLAAGEPVQLPSGTQRQTKVKLLGRNNRPIEFMQVAVTYMSQRPAGNGFKITGRDGAKGVICRIIPDEDMPVDDYGFRADVVIAPNSPFARMNIGQLYEQGINRVSEFVRRAIKERYAIDPHAAGEMLLDYYNDINPNYAALVRSAKSTDALLHAHVVDCIENNISLHIPPGLDTISIALIQKLREKWHVKLSPVTYTQRDMDNNIIGTFRTRNDVCIGSKYIYLLCKIPDPSSPGVAHVNQYSTPMKSPPSDRIRYPIRRGPIRFGEDEGRISLMDLEDPHEVVRLMCLQANSQKGVDAVCQALLTEQYPTRIKRIGMSNSELMQSNTIISLFNHMMATVGLASSKDGPFPHFGRGKTKDRS